MKKFKIKIDLDIKKLMNTKKREDMINQTNNDSRYVSKVFVSKKHKKDKYRNNFLDF